VPLKSRGNERGKHQLDICVALLRKGTRRDRAPDGERLLDLCIRFGVVAEPIRTFGRGSISDLQRTVFPQLLLGIAILDLLETPHRSAGLLAQRLVVASRESRPVGTVAESGRWIAVIAQEFR